MRHNNRRMKGRNNNNGSNNGGQHRRSNNVPPRMQVFDSNGPDVRIRGTAWQVHEKYMALAKDAAAVGDLIMAENYSQHAEHYQRIINTFAEQMGTQWQPSQAQNDDSSEMDGNTVEGVQVQAAHHAHQQNQQQQAPRADRRDDARPAVTADRADLGLPSSLFKANPAPALETA